MSHTHPISAQSEVRGAILGRLESLYTLALENNSLNLCVRILDMMAKLNGLYEQRKKKPGTEPLTLDEFTEDHLSHLMEEISLLEKIHEKKCRMPLQAAPQQKFSPESFSRESFSQNIGAGVGLPQGLSLKDFNPKDFNPKNWGKMSPQKC